MHATEVPHVVETLPMQRLVALNALRIGSGRPLHLGPVTLKARFNAVATDGIDADAEAMATDPLQPEGFTAAWLLGSIAALSVPGVESVSYFEATGPRGIRGPGRPDARGRPVGRRRRPARRRGPGTSTAGCPASCCTPCATRGRRSCSPPTSPPHRCASPSGCRGGDSTNLDLDRLDGHGPSASLDSTPLKEEPP